MDADFRLAPEQASTVAPRVDALFYFITAVCVVFTLAIAVALIWFAVKYRRRSEDYFPKPVVGSTVLETAWSVIPLVIALGMFFWGAVVFFDIRTPPENSLEVYVVGKQWMWHLHHPGGQREINQLHVPVGRPVRFILTSEDVIHDFYIPAFRVKMDAVPGKYTDLWFTATKPGTYDLFCALYCGTDHSRMIGKVIAMEPADYQRWLSSRADHSLALQGRQLFQKLQCITCHHTEAGARRRWRTSSASALSLTTARLRADESYLRESIRYPARKVAAGYRPIMPAYDTGQVPEDDLIKLIAFLKSLKIGQTPRRVEQSDAPEAKKQER